MKSLVLVLLFGLCPGLCVVAQNCHTIYIPKKDFVLVHNRSASELSLTEKDGSFFRKVGKPDSTESGKVEAEELPDYDYLLYKDVFYGKNEFYFIYRGGGNDYEGLSSFEIGDTLFSIKDKSRNVSLRIGDGIEALRRFKPGYNAGCNGLTIQFIVNGKKRDEPLDGSIDVFFNPKTKRIESIGGTRGQ